MLLSPPSAFSYVVDDMGYLRTGYAKCGGKKKEAKVFK